nr:hypothetical protein [Tanacetum cinerariifolium]
MDQNINPSDFDQIQPSHWNRPTFFNDNEEHFVQYKEYLENSSNEIAALNSNQEKEKSPQDFDIRQLVREQCCIEVCEEQKQNMENTLLELIEVLRQKEFYCMHNNEVKNIVEQPTKRGTRIAESLQNFRVVHKKSSISLKNTSQISSVHAITPILPTEEPEYSLIMGYEHLSTIPETESDEVTESSAKNLVPIPSEYEVTFDDESECDMPIKDESSPAFTTFSNPLFDDNDDFTSSDDESLFDENVSMENFKVYSNPLFDDDEINSDKLDPHCFNAESDFVESLSNRDTLIDSSPKIDFFLKEFSGKLAHINPILPGIKEADFDLEEEILEDSDSLMDEIDLFLATDELLPPNIESDNYDSEGDIHFLEELLIDDSIPLPKNESSIFDHDNLSFPRPLPKPPDVESFFDLEPNSREVILVVMNNIDEFNEDECFDPGGEINVFANVEDDDYSAFIFFIRIFLPYLIYPELSPLLLSARSKDTIFDPGIFV